MSDHQAAVQHPADPSRPAFNFYAWRQRRRQMAEQLYAMAAREAGADALDLADIGEAFETETVTEVEARRLAELLDARGGSVGEDLWNLPAAVLAIASAGGHSLPSTLKHAVVVPDWDLTPFSRPIFVGRANGVPAKARLVETTRVIPSYEIIWTHPDGRECAPAPVRSARIGTNLDLAPAVWDWLFARRLTLLCQAKVGDWPSEERPPVTLQGVDWPETIRPF